LSDLLIAITAWGMQKNWKRIRLFAVGGFCAASIQRWNEVSIVRPKNETLLNVWRFSNVNKSKKIVCKISLRGHVSHGI